MFTIAEKYPCMWRYPTLISAETPHPSDANDHALHDRLVVYLAGRLVPAVMFFHIPVSEYDIAATCGLSVRMSSNGYHTKSTALAVL